MGKGVAVPCVRITAGKEKENHGNNTYTIVHKFNGNPHPESKFNLIKFVRSQSK